MLNIRQYFYKPLKVSEVIEIAKAFNDDTDGDPFERFSTLYAEYVGLDTVLTLDTVCYLGDNSKVSEDGEEHYPEFVEENRLEVLCQGSYFIEQLDYVSEQKENFSDQDFLDALNYYLDNDTYLEFD